MEWAVKRKIFYLTILFLIFAFLLFLILRPYFNKEPTCFDGKQNGDETDIDCGGSCVLACSTQMDDISVLWSRIFKVVPGRYNAIAYLENHNENVAVYKIKYRFRFADENNLYLGKREGETFIPASSRFAIFEPAIDLGNSIPVYSTFEFLENPLWVQVDQNKKQQLNISVSNLELLEGKDETKLSAVVQNNSLFRIPEVSFIAILHGISGNVVSVSNTYLEVLQAEEEQNIYFTWPEVFSEEIVFKEIIPSYDIFSAQLE